MTSSVSSIKFPVSTNASFSVHGVKGLADPSPSFSSSSSPFLLLIHGGDRNLQNASHWTRHFPFFFSLPANFLSLDLLGHGDSVPGPSDASFPSMNLKAHVESLKELLEKEEDVSKSQNLVLVGRSYGGAVVHSLLEQLEEKESQKVKRVIFIAPAIDPASFNASLFKGKKVLFCWADEDPIIQFSRFAPIEEKLKEEKIDYELKEFKQILTDEMKEKKQLFWAHLPENATESGTKQWQEAVQSWFNKN